jgi:ATP/ADP translocase
MMGPITALILLGFWGTFNRMFDLRASKRIIGGIDTGQLTATIIAFFAIGLIPETVYDTADLILVSAVCVTVALLFLIQIVRTNDLQRISNQQQQSDVKEVKYTDLFKNNYLKYLSLFLLVSMIATVLMEFTFLNTINVFYPEEAELKRFIAFFSAVVMIGSFIIQTFFNDYIIGTYGLRVSLMVMRAILGLFCVGAAITGNIFGYSVKNDELIYFFMFITLGRFSSAAFKDALENPAFKLFFLPLDIKIRFDVQTKIEGVINELSALIGGTLLVILGLEYFKFFELVAYTYLILILVVVMYFITKELYVEYRKTLEQTLHRNKQETMELRDDRNIINVILDEARDENPKKAVYGLKILEKIDPMLLENELLNRLHEEDKDLREFCVQKLRQLRSIDSLNALQENVEKNNLGETKELALQAIG